MHLLDFMSSDAMAVDTLYNDIELDSLDVTDQMVQVSETSSYITPQS